MKLTIVDWSDDAYRRTKKATGTASSEIIAEIEVDRFTVLSFDGGRLDIQGYPETIWMWGNQWSIEVGE